MKQIASIDVPARQRRAIGSDLFGARLPSLLALLLVGLAGCRFHDNILGDNAHDGGPTSGTCEVSGQTYPVGATVLLSPCTSCVCQADATLRPCENTCPSGNGGVLGSAGGMGGAASNPSGAAGAGGSSVIAAGDRLPCDIYAADGGPCVAAHSTVRALSSAYAGPLYQVRKSDGTTRDIGVLAPGGFADAAAQDAFCGPDACFIALIYDQSGYGNHLAKAPAGQAKSTPANEANANILPITIGGHNVYGLHVTPGVGYRNNQAHGTSTGDDPETIYMITSGDFHNAGCCFDYGNAETNSVDAGEGAVEAVYFGSCTIWGKGAGDGPWVMADLENGLWAGDQSPYLANTSVAFKYVTGMVKGDKAFTNHWTLKVANAQAGALKTMFDGQRPSPRYVPMKKQGAIILGTAGDNSNAAQGNFFEGVMTAQYASDAADEAVQANIASVYGR